MSQLSRELLSSLGHIGAIFNLLQTLSLIHRREVPSVGIVGCWRPEGLNPLC